MSPIYIWAIQGVRIHLTEERHLDPAARRNESIIITVRDITIGERDNGRETKDSVRDGKGVKKRRLLYGQFPQISAKNEKQK